ncbi:MAG: PH domain-containing protein [Acidobacteriota bacterium]|nr:PH domain-containing protein [Acidobacteriota bacterium]MDH3784966.1 PH domain-containing protein [Acidobacteriota bacterium]
MPESPRTEERQLDPRSVTLSRAWSAIFAVIVGLGFLFTTSMITIFGDSPRIVTWIGFGAAFFVPSFILVVWTWLWPPLQYRHTRYRMDQEGIWIIRGVWFRGETSIPITRIQHIDVTQGPIERAFGLGTLIIYTAGTQHASESLAGLSHEEATRLRDTLIAFGESDGV